MKPGTRVYGIQSIIGRWWISESQDWTAFIGDATLSTAKSSMDFMLECMKEENRAGAQFAKVVELCGQSEERD